MIEVEPGDSWLLDCPLFQRMRHVRQTGFTYLTYPNAQHTRFEHSLGVYFVVKRLLATFRRTREAFEFEVRQRGQPDGVSGPRITSGLAGQYDCCCMQRCFMTPFVFSHVSERLFASKAGRLKIGNKTVSLLSRISRIVRASR